MSTRREFLGKTLAAGFVTATLGQVPVARSINDGAGGKIKSRAGASIKAVIRRDETLLRYPVHGDNWHMSWASDDRQYLSLCDGAGLTSEPKMLYNSRMLAMAGDAQSATFQDLPNYPTLGAPSQKATDTRYYGFGTLAFDGGIYQFMSTFNRSFRSQDLEKSDPNDLMHFNGTKLIYSTDSGRVWRNQDGSSPVVWEPWSRRSRSNMAFFEEDQGAFSLLSVLQMGRNYEFNRDGFVYVYAPNGYTDGSMNELVMFRAPRKALLDRGSYEFFAGWGPSRAAKWDRDINARVAVHTFPRGWVNKLVHPYAWQPSVVYNAPLGLYMMVTWGMGCASDGMWFDKPSYLGFWVASHPWGPWVQIHEETAWLPGGDESARAYQPQIAPKWIAADGKSLWLVWTDFQGADSAAMTRFWGEYQRKAEAGAIDEEDLRENVIMMRKHMPFYVFNVQRVDLIV